ncbi:MAG TPA: hypothetical protein VN944_12970 [Nitrospiria bacterium]|nr:hypothetical protein [Nitrospiria bacterium]
MKRFQSQPGGSLLHVLLRSNRRSLILALATQSASKASERGKLHPAVPVKGAT